MKWEISYNDSDNVLSINAEGSLNLKTEENLRNETFEWIKKYNCLNCLVDFRNIKEVRLRTLDIYNLPRIYSNQNIPRDIKLALIISNTHAEDFTFFENVCRNNGYSAKTFFGREEALSWLKD